MILLTGSCAKCGNRAFANIQFFLIVIQGTQVQTRATPIHGLLPDTKRADTATVCGCLAVDNTTCVSSLSHTYVQLTLVTLRLYLKSLEPGAIICAYVRCCIEGLNVFGFARHACVYETLLALRKKNEKLPCSFSSVSKRESGQKSRPSKSLFLVSVGCFPLVLA